MTEHHLDAWAPEFLVIMHYADAHSDTDSDIGNVKRLISLVVPYHVCSVHAVNSPFQTLQSIFLLTNFKVWERASKTTWQLNGSEVEIPIPVDYARTFMSYLP